MMIPVFYCDIFFAEVASNDVESLFCIFRRNSIQPWHRLLTFTAIALPLGWLTVHSRLLHSTTYRRHSRLLHHSRLAITHRLLRHSRLAITHWLLRHSRLTVSHWLLRHSRILHSSHHWLLHTWLTVAWHLLLLHSIANLTVSSHNLSSPHHWLLHAAHLYNLWLESISSSVRVSQLPLALIRGHQLSL